MNSKTPAYILTVTLILAANAHAQETEATPEEGTISAMSTGTEAAPISSIRTEIKAPKPAPVITAETYGLADSGKYYSAENFLEFKQKTGHSVFTALSGRAVQFRGGEKDYAHFSGNKLLGGVEAQVTPQINLSGSLGAGKLTVHDSFGKVFESSRTIPVGEIAVAYSMTNTTKFKLTGSEDFAYMHFETDDRDADVMNLRKGVIEVDTRFIPKWQLKSTAAFSFYGDGNERQKHDHMLVREVVTDPLTLSAGISGGWRGFKFRSNQYISPEHRENYGLRFIGQKPLTSSWNLEGDVFYGYDQTRNSKRYNVSNTDIAASYTDKSGWLLRAAATFYTQHNGRFWENSGSLTLEIPL